VFGIQSFNPSLFFKKRGVFRIFLGCEFFLAEKMNSDGIVFGGKRMRENKALFLELILRIAN